MTDRPETGASAFLIDIQFYPSSRQAVDLNELRELVYSAGLHVAGDMHFARKVPDPRLFVGKGKAAEICAAVKASTADLVIINHALTPAQQRNLEKVLNCRVMDRTELILLIFARRARSFEGKLQVELATLKHQSTRLVRGWTHLERQRGGIGLRGGPGETQLETDRRLIRGRMRQVTEQLEKVRAQRAEGRKSRQKADLPTVALVGYTNAGKSTLFNRLTGADAYAADQLFATLDPTLRRVNLPEVGTVVFADTVGFIRDLPHDLIHAFRATLEEVTEAALLLHVVDVSDPDRQRHLASVQSVLSEIGAADVPQMVVYNKMDLEGDPGTVADVFPPAVTGRFFISAQTGVGIDVLCSAVAAVLAGQVETRTLLIKSDEAAFLAKLYRYGAVVSVEDAGEGVRRVVARLPESGWRRISR